MNYKYFYIIIFLCSVSKSYAEDFSYDFISLSAGKSTLKNTEYDESYDGKNISVQAVLSLNDVFFLQADYKKSTYSVYDETLTAITNYVGIGAHHLLVPKVEVYGVASLANEEIHFYDETQRENGSAFEVGVRWLFSDVVELNYGIKRLDLEDSQQGFFVGGLIHLNKRIDIGASISSLGDERMSALTVLIK